MTDARATSLRRGRTWVVEQLVSPLEVRATRGREPFVDAVLPKGGVGAELGVFKGRFSRVLLEVTDARCLHLVDPWFHLTSTWHWGRGDRSTVNAVRRILRRLRPEIESGRVQIHIGDDRAVLARFDEHTLDWAYLDSSHAYDHTVAELALLHRAVRPGGIIAGDDWRPDPAHPHHGVHRAVMELVERDGYQLVYADPDDRQWAVVRPESR